MTDPFTAAIGAKVASKVLPLAIAAGAGFLLAAVLVGVPAYFMVRGANNTATAAQTERDTYKGAAAGKDTALQEQARVMERLNHTLAGLTVDWRDSRDKAAEADAARDSLAQTYESEIARLMREGADATKDPAANALAGLQRLQCIREARAGAAAPC